MASAGINIRIAYKPLKFQGTSKLHLNSQQRQQVQYSSVHAVLMCLAKRVLACGAHVPAPYPPTYIYCRPACYSDKERGRGDNAVWATDGSGGVGLTSARAPDKINIKYAYDLVFDTTTSNEQVR
jgi:hypothetical protein